MKICKRCQEVKSLTEFSLQHEKYFTLYCKSCVRIRYKERKSKLSEKDKAEIQRRKYEKRKEVSLQAEKAKNRELTRLGLNFKKLEYRRKYYHTKSKNNQNFLIKTRLRAKLNAGLRGKIPEFKSLDVGCNLQELKKHLESKFKSGMSWKNYGKGEDKWQVDHIIPCCKFDLTQINQQKECFHYSNLQPLWTSENMSKSSKILNSLQ